MHRNEEEHVDTHRFRSNIVLPDDLKEDMHVKDLAIMLNSQRNIPEGTEPLLVKLDGTVLQNGTVSTCHLQQGDQLVLKYFPLNTIRVNVLIVTGGDFNLKFVIDADPNEKIDLTAKGLLAEYRPYTFKKKTATLFMDGKKLDPNQTFAAIAENSEKETLDLELRINDE